MSKKYIGGTPARISDQTKQHEAFLAERKLRDVSNVPDPRDIHEREADKIWKPIGPPNNGHRFDGHIEALHEEGTKRDSKDHLLPFHQRLARHLEVEREKELANDGAQKARSAHLKSVAADLVRFDEVERRVLENKDLFDMRDFENLRKGREQLKAGPDFPKEIAFEFLAKVEAKEQSVLSAKRSSLLGQRAALDTEIGKLSTGLRIDAEPEADSESDFDRQLREWKEKKQLIDEAVARNDIAEAYRLLGVELPTVENEGQDET